MCVTSNSIEQEGDVTMGRLPLKGKDRRRNRVNISITDAYESRLKKLAKVCNLTESSAAEMLLRKCLCSPDIIQDVQNEYGVNPKKRIFVQIINNEIKYMLGEDA
jgi:hypothetical protein